MHALSYEAPHETTMKNRAVSDVPLPGQRESHGTERKESFLAQRAAWNVD